MYQINKTHPEVLHRIAVVALLTGLIAYPLLVFAQDTGTSSAQTGTAASTTQAESDVDTSTNSDEESASEPTATSSQYNTAQEDEEMSTTTESEKTASTSVKTGDAQAVSSAENAVNTNDISSTSTSQESSTSTATSTTTGSESTTPQVASSSTPDLASGSTTPIEAASSSVAGVATSTLPTSTTPHNSSTTVAATNTAAVSNEVSVTADTGGNTASSSNQSVSIQTGDATAYARILNKVNTNTIDSSGTVSFINNLAGNISAINLREAPVFSQNKPPATNSSSTTRNCNSVDSCSDDTTIKTSNTATVTNTVTARSSTGGNQASGTNATISTGDAYAAADVVNIANTNIVDSSYLLFSFNNFGDWSGDLVFPNKNVIANNFSQPETTTGQETSTSNRVEAESANASNNSIGTFINNSGADVTNADQFMVALQVHGDWTGEVFNAPDSLQWQKGKNGLRVFTAGTGTSPVQPSDADITTDNQADVNNDVDVHALTGKNQATSSTGTSSITTGTARASSNVINVVNTNVVGQNMLLGVLNIFGDWDGNISFGQPDLWVGGVADTTGNPRLQPGSTIDVTYDVVNRGDADAHDVQLDLSSGSGLELLPMNSASNTAPTGSITLPIGDIPAGKAVQVKSRLKVDGEVSRDNHTSKSTAAVSLHETDANTENNTEIINLTLNQPGELTGTPSGIIPADLTRSGENDSDDGRNSRVLGDTDSSNLPDVSMYHSVDKSTTTASSTAVTYRMRVENDSDKALKKGLVTDRMIAGNNQPLNTESFKLGKIYPGEEIKISYTTVLAHGSTPSVTNRAHAKARHEGQTVVSNTATSSVQLPSVAGAQDKKLSVCHEKFDDYIWVNEKNNTAAVRQLQEFLNKNQETNLAVTGRYNQQTQTAVEAFQSEYAEDILRPWGIQQPTGNVYRTTLAKMNDIACGSRVRTGDLERLEDALRDLQSTVAALPTESTSASRQTRQEVAQTQK